MTVPLTVSPQPASRLRRLVLIGGIFGLGLLAVLVLVRTLIVGGVVVSVLRGMGATDISFQVTQVTPGRIVVEEIAFTQAGQPLYVDRILLTRARWWTASFGELHVERMKTTVNLDQVIARSPEKKTEATPAASSALAGIPFEGITFGGKVTLQAVDAPEQELSVDFTARPATEQFWSASARVTGPGLSVQGEGTYDLADGALTFKLPQLALELKPWDAFVRRFLPVPVSEWDLAGKFSGSVEGRFAAGQVVADGQVRLREGRAVLARKSITAEGIEADLDFVDFIKFTTKPGKLTIRELRTGELPLRDLIWDFAFDGMDRLVVSQVSLHALGGSVSAEPFTYVPSRDELTAVLLVDGISVEEVMALTQSLPAKATGRVNGRFPVHIDGAGLKLGTGWLELKPGVRAEIQFNAKGLLTNGTKPSSPSYAVLQKVESGLLKLGISELRLDIRPLNAPEGRSAQLHIKGEPVDKEIKAPVVLDLNVNGPLEKLLNLGLDSRLSVAPKK